MTVPSYYFTLFKKLQVLGHVPTASQHGAGAGGFNLTQPDSVFGTSDTGALLGPTTTPADSPVWAVLNSRAAGNAAFSPVTVGGDQWPTMPAADTPAWLEFQVDAPPPQLVTALGDWIAAGKPQDTPTGVLAQVPPQVAEPEPGIRLFACNMPGDDGAQPVPANYWATALIFLVDPATGATVNPAALAAADAFHLVALVGNRGRAGAGRYLGGGAGPKIVCAAQVMVFNTGFSPAVKLPALSNLDVQATQPAYEIYFLRPSAYDAVGFRLDVQTVFDGLVAAIEAADVDLGGLSATEWVHAEHAHLCARVTIRHADESWPAAADTPLLSRRVAQRNLAPFAVDLAVEDPDPNIEWLHFMVGEPARRARTLGHVLSVQGRMRQPIDLYLALPRKAFEAHVDAAGVKGFEVVCPDVGPPFPDAVVLRRVAPTNAVPLRVLGRERCLAACLGIGYRRSQLEPGPGGRVSAVQRTAVRPGRAVTGGLTVDVSVRAAPGTTESRLSSATEA